MYRARRRKEVLRGAIRRADEGGGRAAHGVRYRYLSALIEAILHVSPEPPVASTGKGIAQVAGTDAEECTRLGFHDEANARSSRISFQYILCVPISM